MFSCCYFLLAVLATIEWDQFLSFFLQCKQKLSFIKDITSFGLISSTSASFMWIIHAIEFALYPSIVELAV